MNNFEFIVFFLVMVFTFGCHKPLENLSIRPVIYQKINGELEVTAIGIDMRYTIGIPSTYSPGDSPPLILALHYGGTVIPNMGRDFLEILIEPALKNLEAIIVAPNCPGDGWTDPISEEAVLALLEQIIEEYSVDANRSLVTGFSLGGIGTWHFAAFYTDMFAAAIPISGMPRQEAFDTISSIPLYVIHSRMDEVFPFSDVQAVVNELNSRGLSILLKIVENVSHYDTSSFVGPLNQTIPWIKTHWNQ